MLGGRSALAAERPGASGGQGRAVCGRSSRQALEQLAVGHEHADQRPPELVGDRRERGRAGRVHSGANPVRGSDELTDVGRRSSRPIEVWVAGTGLCMDLSPSLVR